MSSLKPSIPKGTRDFGVVKMTQRNYIFDIIRTVFQKYGFKPIETPAIENLSTLLGKYGEEGDRLIFKIINSGNFLTEKVFETLDKNKNSSKINNEKAYFEVLKDISEKALRYDLTIPFARYVVMNRDEIILPFKRYQIQPVWRADKPQKGRYREFYQCDVDVIGSNSLLNEVELIQLSVDIFDKLGIEIKLKINNRKVLFGISEIIGISDKFYEFTSIIDKLDKISSDEIEKELYNKGFKNDTVCKIFDFINELPKNNSNHKKLNFLKQYCNSSNIALQGISETETIFEYLNILPLKYSKFLNSEDVEFDFCLARGLNYYTGPIFEVKAKKSIIGSIGGGGRYDDLTGIFGMPDISGVGISFGTDRIYDVMDELKLFPANIGSTTQLLFVNFGGEEEKYCLKLVTEARNQNINTEIYPSNIKMKKQFDYANKNNICFVAVVGSEELKADKITLKNMCSGEQFNFNFQELINYIHTQK